jgi:hypothetical protein
MLFAPPLSMEIERVTSTLAAIVVLLLPPLPLFALALAPLLPFHDEAGATLSPVVPPPPPTTAPPTPLPLPPTRTGLEGWDRCCCCGCCCSMISRAKLYFHGGGCACGIFFFCGSSTYFGGCRRRPVFIVHRGVKIPWSINGPLLWH